MAKVTRLENKVLILSKDLYNTFLRLPAPLEVHRNDQEDMAFHVRAIQNIILARPEMRTMRLTKRKK